MYGVVVGNKRVKARNIQSVRGGHVTVNHHVTESVCVTESRERKS